MRLKFSLLAILALLCFAANTQTIEGRVTDGAKPLENVTVSFLKPDSSLLKITVTTKAGRFIFEEIKQPGMLQVSSVAHTVYFSPLITPGTDKIVIPDIVLQTKVTDLKNVSVTAVRPLLQYKGDKLIVNLDAAPSNAGASLLEVLAKMPGVTIDEKGMITLRGKPGVMVMIDGKETFLSGEDLTNLLRNTPASGSDQIEIITNPSSRYDAATTGGIINIKSKKSLKEGLNGSFTIAPGIGLYKNENKKTKTIEYLRNSANWNYRKNKVNLFGNASFSVNQYAENFYEQRYFFNNNQSTGSLINDNFFFSPSRFYQLRAGMDFFINKRSVLGFIAGNNYSTSTSKSSTATNIMDGAGTTTYLMEGSSVNPGSHSFNGSYNVNYKYTHGIKSKEFTADLNYILYRNVAKVNIESYFFDQFNNPLGNPLLLRQSTGYDFDVYVAKLDYTQTLGKWRMETGVKSTYTKSNSDQSFLRKNGANYVDDKSRSNRFIYRENINAAYLIAGNKIKKTDIQLGLRVEQTIGNGLQKANDSSFKRSRIDVFPSIILNHAVTEKYSIGINYSRKLNRPSFRSLNPFVFVTDSLYSFQGNPFLLPQFSHNFELTNLINSKISIDLAYNFFNKIITNMVQNDPATKMTRTYIDNFNKFKVFIASATVPLKPVKSWSLTASGRFLRNHYSGISEGATVDLYSSGIILTASNNFTISDLYSADVNFDYTSKKLLGALIYFDYPFNYDLGLRRKFKNGKGNVALSMNTPFYFPIRKGKAAYGSTFFDQRAAFATQRYNLSFTYRFGKTSIEAQRNKRNATAEEQNRL